MIDKLYNSIALGDTVIARRGRKVIAAVGTVTRAAHYDPKQNRLAYPRGYTYPNHIGVRWHDHPREIAFPNQVFGMQTLHEISGDRFDELVGDDAARQKTRDLFPDDLSDDVDFTEGGRKTVTVNAYERDPRARRVCISIHGLRCSVCDMSFEEEYGPIGEGFIHVHHLKAVAAQKTKYRLRPMTDLAPVCPNCHAMLHTRNPPLTVEQLQSILRKQSRMRG
jgi:hypothetical protein